MSEKHTEEIVTRYRVDLSDFKTKIKQANDSIKESNAMFKVATAGMDKWDKSSSGLTAKLKQLNSIIDQEKIKLEQYKKELKETDKAEKENAKRAEALRKQLKALETTGDTTSKKYRDMQKALRLVDKEQVANQKSSEALKTRILSQTAAVNKLERDIDKYSSSLENVKKNEAQADSSMGKLTAEIEKQEKELNDLSNKYKNVVLVQGKNSKETKELKGELVKLSTELNKNKSVLSSTEKAVEELRLEFDSAGNATDKARDGFTVMKGALSDLVANGIRRAISGLKNIAKDAVQTGAEFDAAMSKVESISGATGKELDKLREKAKEMGEATKFTATEAAEAFNYMAMAGWETEQMLDGIEGIMNLAAASGEDFATTSDIVTDALTALGYAAGDAGQLADVMAAASANANTNVSLMGSTFQYVAPIAGTLGYSMEDLSVAIGLMANSGIKGTKAGTALRSMFTRLAALPKAAAEEMGRLGISITDASGKAKPLMKTIGELRNKFKGLSKEQQTAAAKNIAGTTAMSGFLSIVNASEKDLKKLTKAVKNSSGAAIEMSEIALDNLSGDLTLLDSQLEGVKINLTEKLTPSLRKAISKISEFVKAIDWDNIGEKAGVVIQDLVDKFIWLIENGKSVSAAISWVTGALVALKGATIVYNGINALTNSFKLLNAVMLAHPAGTVVAALGLLVAAIGALNAMTPKTVADSEQRLQAAQKEREKIDSAAQAYREMRQAQSETFQDVEAQYNHLGKLKNELLSLADSTGKVTESERARARVLLKELSEGLGKEYSMTGNQINQYKTLKTEIDKVISAKKAEAVLTAFRSDYENNIKRETEAIKTARQARKDYARQLAAWGNAEMAYKQAHEEMLKVIESGEMTWEEMVHTSTFDYVRELRRQADVEKAATQEREAAMKTAIETREQYSNSIKQYMAAQTAAEDGYYKKSLKIMRASGENWKKYTKTVKEEGSKAGQELIKETTKAAKKAEKEQKTEAKKVGKDFASGVSEGVKEGSSTIFPRFKDALENTLTNLKVEFDIHSPSRRTAKELGVPLAQGIAKGFSDQASVLSNTFANTVKKALLKANKKGNYTETSDSVVEMIGKKLEKKATASVKQVERIVNRTVKEMEKKDKESATSIKNAGEKTVAEFSKNMTKYASSATKAVKSILEGSAEEYQKQMDRIKGLKENIMSSMDEIAETYTVDDSGKFSLVDPQQNLLDIWEYSRAIDYLKQQTPKKLFEEISAMEPENAISFAKELSKMSDVERKSYIDGWKLVQREQKAILNNMFSGEVLQIKAEYDKTVSEALKGIRKKLKGMGENAMEGFLEGLKSKKKKTKGALKEVFADVIKTVKEELDINSPSKVFASLGEYSGQGYIGGLSKTLRDVRGTMSGMVNSLKNTKFGSGTVTNNNNTTTNNNNTNYTQIINAPKAPSRIELYRQTKNLLALK